MGVVAEKDKEDENNEHLQEGAVSTSLFLSTLLYGFHLCHPTRDRISEKVILPSEDSSPRPDRHAGVDLVLDYTGIIRPGQVLSVSV